MDSPQHYTNSATRGYPHEAGPGRCWCVDSADVLRAEIARLRVEVEGWKHGSQHEAEAGDEARAELADARSEIERLKEEEVNWRTQVNGFQHECERLRATIEDAIGELQCAREAIADRTSVADTRVARALIPLMDALDSGEASHA
jgi:chromosome segregation ATPase